MSSSNKAPQGEALASAPAAPGKDLFDGLFGDLPAEAAAVKKEDTRPKEEAEAEGTKKRKGAEEDGDGNGEGGQKRPKEEGAAAAVSKEGKGSVDLEAALQKISGALRSSKVDKFRKVRGCVSLSFFLGVVGWYFGFVDRRASPVYMDMDGFTTPQ